MALVFVVIMLVLATYVSIVNRKLALLMMVFFSSWSGFDIDIGLRVTIYLLFLIPLSVVVLFSAHKKSEIPKLGVLWFVIAYAVLWSVMQIPFLPDEEVKGGTLRSPELRALFQILMFIITLLPIIIVPLSIRRKEQVEGVVKAYLASAMVLSIIGWIQLAIWFATGSDPIPVGYLNHLLGGMGTIRSGQFQFGNSIIYRMSSFGGEPRDLGGALVVGLLLIQSGIKGKCWLFKYIWPFLFASMVATFSTSAIVIWLFASVIQYLSPRKLGFFSLKVSFKPSSKRLLLVFAGMLIALAGLVAKPDYEILQMVKERTYDRLVGTKHEEGQVLEDFNAAIISYLKNNPVAILTGVGLGDIHLYANEYLPSYAREYAENTSFVAKSSMLRWVSEIGIVSLLVMVYWTFVQTKVTSKSLREIDEVMNWSIVITKFIIPLVSFWLISSYINPQFFIAIGMLFSLRIVANHLSKSRLTSCEDKLLAMKSEPDLPVQP